MTASNSSTPVDFDSYWSAVQEELEQYPIAPELTVIPLHSTDFATVYGARFTSIGPFRLFAYYSVPKGDGPFPVICQMPRYGSVVHVPAYEDRQRYVTLSLRHRGQRLSDQPYAAAFPGLLTDGIADPAQYIYRGIVADCCRTIDFLLSQPEVDDDRIAVVGNDLALLSAALRPQVDAVYAAPGHFHRAQELAPATSAYPLEEINDYLRTYPHHSDAVWQTLSYFDPIHLAPKVKASTLLVTGSEKDAYPAAALQPLAEALGGPVETYETAHSAYKDGVHQEEWLRKRYGFSEPLLPPHWQR